MWRPIGRYVLFYLWSSVFHLGCTLASVSAQLPTDYSTKYHDWQDATQCIQFESLWAWQHALFDPLLPMCVKKTTCFCFAHSLFHSDPSSSVGWQEQTDRALMKTKRGRRYRAESDSLSAAHQNFRAVIQVKDRNNQSIMCWKKDGLWCRNDSEILNFVP